MEGSSKYTEFKSTWRILLIVLLVVATSLPFYKQSVESNLAVVSDSLSTNYWELFESISNERRFFEEENAYYRIPIFTPELEVLRGKELIISGYYLPYSKSDSVIIISRFPNASCFFCGQAGIESVAMVELENASSKNYKMDQILVVKGKLMLNSTNLKKLAFVIADARVVE